jgi:branched-chain amino acid transport system permease protein
MVLAFVLLSELTQAWQLYLGLIFIVMVMLAPGGVAALIMAQLRLARSGGLRRLWPAYVLLLASALLALSGAAALLEMLYHLQLGAALGPELRFMGITLDTQAPGSWLGALVVMLAGLGLFESRRRPFVRAWDEIQQAIAQDIKRREVF